MKIERTMKRGVNAVKSTMNDFTISTLFSHFRHGDKSKSIKKRFCWFPSKVTRLKSESRHVRCFEKFSARKMRNFLARAII